MLSPQPPDKSNLVIVTGGSRGLGHALVELYEKNDWSVKSLSRTGSSENSVQCDLSDLHNAAGTLNELFNQLSTVGWEKVVLINNVATLGPIGKIHQKNEQDWINNINTNFSANVLVTGLFLKYFESHGCAKFIASISSGAARKPYFGWSLYCAAKAALESFSNCIALEQSKIPNGAKAFVINPGIIDTQMQESIRKTDHADFPDVERFIGYRDEGELASAEFIAAEVYKLIESSVENGGLYQIQE